MTENIWLADELTTDIDLDLVSLVSSSLTYDVNKVRAFVVALLEDVTIMAPLQRLTMSCLGSNRFLGLWRNGIRETLKTSFRKRSVGSSPTSPTKIKIK